MGLFCLGRLHGTRFDHVYVPSASSNSKYVSSKGIKTRIGSDPFFKYVQGVQKSVKKG